MKPRAESFSSTTIWLTIAGSMMRDRLRDLDDARHRALAQPDAVRGLDLAPRHRVDAGAEDLGQHRAVVEREPDDQRAERRDVDAEAREGPRNAKKISSTSGSARKNSTKTPLA